MWWFKSFNGVELPAGEFSADLPRTFVQNQMSITGSGLGQYDLEGSLNRAGQQQYTAEGVLPSCDLSRLTDLVFGTAGGRGILKKTDGIQTRRTTARLTSISESSSITDFGINKVGLQFLAEPFWYDDVLTVVNFANAPYVNLAGANSNRGNARAYKHFILVITSLFAAGVWLTIEPTSAPNYSSPLYGSFKYGRKLYGLPLSPSQASSTLLYTVANNTPIMFNAGTSVVKTNFEQKFPSSLSQVDGDDDRMFVGGIDAYQSVTLPTTQTALFWLSPGDNVIHFSQATTGFIYFRSTWI